MRLVLHAPKQLLMLLAASSESECSFFHQLMCDLEWLYESTSFPEELKTELGSPKGFPELWFKFIFSRSSQFKTRVKAAEALEHCPIEFEVKFEDGSSECRCHVCGIVCKNKHVLNGHLAAMHGHRNPLKKHISGTHCLVCLKDFGNRLRLCEHVVNRSKFCGPIYRKFVPQLSLEALAQQEADEAATERAMKWQGKHIRHSEVPVVRICGPVMDRARLAAFANSI